MSAQAVQLIADFAVELDDAVTGAEDWELGEAVTFLHALNQCKAALAMTARNAEAMVVELMAGEKRTTIEGVGTVEVNTDTKRTDWDNDAVVRVLVARALDERILDPETGEFEPAHEAVARVLNDCARPSWRVTALREHGVDEDEYCRTTFGQKKVRLYV